MLEECFQIFLRTLLKGKIIKLKTYGVEGKFITLLENDLKKLKPKGSPKWSQFFLEKILAEVPQRSVLGPLIFLIQINDLPRDISSICKMFADDNSLFPKVKDSRLSLSDLNYDLETIN